MTMPFPGQILVFLPVRSLSFAEFFFENLISSLSFRTKKSILQVAIDAKPLTLETWGECSQSHTLHFQNIEFITKV